MTPLVGVKNNRTSVGLIYDGSESFFKQKLGGQDPKLLDDGGGIPQYQGRSWLFDSRL